MVDEEKKLTPEEIDALLALVTKKDEVAVPAEQTAQEEVVTYDFKRPERISNEQIRSFTMLHENFARNLASTLTTQIRDVVEVEIAHVEQITYSEFIIGLPNPGCISVLSVSPSEGNIYIELSYSILFPLIDRLLGGSGKMVSIPTRPLTEVEWQVTNAILYKAFEHLEVTWKSLGNFSFNVLMQESNPNLLPGIQPNEPIIRFSLKIKMMNYTGLLTIGFPYITIESILPTLTSRTWLATTKKHAIEQSDELYQNLLDTDVVLFCEARRSFISVKEFINMKPGDIIVLNHAKEQPFILRVSNKPLFYVTIGLIRNKKSAKIIEIIKD